jgi:hypothetical protein
MTVARARLWKHFDDETEVQVVAATSDLTFCLDVLSLSEVVVKNSDANPMTVALKHCRCIFVERRGGRCAVADEV